LGREHARIEQQAERGDAEHHVSEVGGGENVTRPAACDHGQGAGRLPVRLGRLATSELRLAALATVVLSSA
jgi:hypothetical protein